MSDTLIQRYVMPNYGRYDFWPERGKGAYIWDEYGRKYLDFAGGVAIRAAVLDDSGAAVYERIFFRESGWIRADFHSSGDAIVRQNF